ncbi:MAG: hypothetical protein JWQ43_3816 [Glaciihabitans sp.]|nr:hypothetical protein [Glaciihabitans sp.]
MSFTEEDVRFVVAADAGGTFSRVGCFSFDGRLLGFTSVDISAAAIVRPSVNPSVCTATFVAGRLPTRSDSEDESLGCLGCLAPGILHVMERHRARAD